MRNADRIVPSSNGSSHSRFCASFAYLASTSMLPVSGAAQFMASGAVRDLPVISAISPYSRLLKPAPSLYWSLGKNRFHKPSFLALAFSSSTMAG